MVLFMVTKESELVGEKETLQISCIFFYRRGSVSLHQRVFDLLSDSGGFVGFTHTNLSYAEALSMFWLSSLDLD